MTESNTISDLCGQVVGLLREQSRTLTTIESCTGGLVGAMLSSIAGVSDVYVGGYITYSNEMKASCVGVSPKTIEEHGAVSGQTAIEMASGGLRAASADLAVSITGIAGPSGGSEEKPVGTVWICITRADRKPDCRRFVFVGDREAIRTAAALTAIKMLKQSLRNDLGKLADEYEQLIGYTQS